MTNYTNYSNTLVQKKGKSVFKKPAIKLLYMYLSSLKNCDKIYPSIESIAEAVCVTPRTAMSLVQEAEELDLIEVKRVQGESNQYTVKDVTDEEIDTTPVKELQEEPVKKVHPITKKDLKNKTLKNNISLTSESVIDSLVKDFPNVPVQEIANELESDISVIIKTVNQFKGLLTYRVKNYRPMQNKPVQKASRKVTRTDNALVDNYEKLDSKISTSKVSISDVMAKINAMKAI